jgi:FkbM family methyltransferase
MAPSLGRRYLAPTPRMFRRPRDWFSQKMTSLARRLASDDGWATQLEELGAVNMRASLQRMAQLGVRPRTIVDGGANVGDWTRLCRRVFPQAKILMVEAQPEHRQALAALCATDPSHLRYASTLLGPRANTTATMYVTEDAGAGTGSSVLPENTDVPRRAVELPMTSLDALLAAQQLTPDLIKLDVQGYEIEVLKGATTALRQAEFVLLELSFWPYNDGAPLLAESLAWMAQAGFRAFDVFDLARRRDAVLLQGDFLFVREGARWVADAKSHMRG